MSPSFLYNAPPTTTIYTLSLHDALPISDPSTMVTAPRPMTSIVRSGHTMAAVSSSSPIPRRDGAGRGHGRQDRKSTRLNSSHGSISYAVFCLKKKKNNLSVYDMSLYTSG